MQIILRICLRKVVRPQEIAIGLGFTPNDWYLCAETIILCGGILRNVQRVSDAGGRNSHGLLFVQSAHGGNGVMFSSAN